MKTTHLHQLTLSLAAAVFGGAAAFAQTPIAVTNPSFELDAVVADGGTIPNATGWTTLTGNTLGTDTVSTFNPTGAQFTGAAGLAGVAPGMAGPQALLMQTALVGLTGSITQTTGALLTLGETYTLTVAVGNPGTDAFQGYAISILAGTNTLATSPVGDEYNVASGTFTDKTLSFIAGPNVAGLANLPVTIVLTTLPSLTAGAGVAYDNVRLDIAPVPEPTPVEAIATGLGLLLLGNLVKSQRRALQGAGHRRSSSALSSGIQACSGV